MHDTECVQESTLVGSTTSGLFPQQPTVIPLAGTSGLLQGARKPLTRTLRCGRSLRVPAARHPLEAHLRHVKRMTTESDERFSKRLAGGRQGFFGHRQSGPLAKAIELHADGAAKMKSSFFAAA
jgi:hypothetical protein